MKPPKTHPTYLETNRASWDMLADLHYHDPKDWYDIKGFLDGRDARAPIDVEGLGDLRGKRLLHSQCHFGLDTLSCARFADHVTGLDFSAPAIANARDLAQRAGLSHRADFVQANVYDAGEVLAAESFDLIYASWGVTGWLPSVHQWAEVLCKLLKPGGTFFYADGHPSAWMFEEGEDATDLIHAHSYWIEDAIVEEAEESYTGVKIPDAGTREYVEFAHTLDDFFTAFLDQDMTLKTFKEHDEIPWRLFKSMIRNPERRLFTLPEGRKTAPLGFSFKWQKPL